jgi:hypothetical protein
MILPMALSKDELLKVRYKVIADYPKSIHKVGDVLYCDENGPRMSQYPHLFKTLEWWEERAEDDMPEYVKYPNDARRFAGKVFKVNMFDPPYLFNCEKDEILCVDRVEPADESEYITYRNSLKQPSDGTK